LWRPTAISGSPRPNSVAAELGRTLDFAKVPKREKAEVLAAFAAHKDEVTAGYVAGGKRG
jgi:hemoglobin